MSGSGRELPDEQGCVEWLLERVAEHVRREVGEDTPLIECGLDSVALLSLYGTVEEEFGPLSDEPVDLWPYLTVRTLAQRLTGQDEPVAADARPRTALVFTGQGCQHPGMTEGLHRQCTAYRHHLAAADEALAPHLGRSVVELIRGKSPAVDETALAQPALFAVGYALAATLLEEGVRPVALLGHGAGEFAAATACGALSLPDAAHLVSARGALMQQLPSNGGMMATCADPYEAAEAVAAEPGVSIGALNAARATVLSGDLPGLRRASGRLGERGISSTFLKVTHAFQSPLMEPVAPLLEEAARRLPAAAPTTPFYSTVYGRRYDAPPDAGYWARHVTSPVRFADAMRALLAEQRPTHVVEVGPKAVLLPFVRRMGGRTGPRCLPMCRGPRTNAVDLAGILSALDAGPLAEDSGHAPRW
ncbi:acyltransferase domain-containing protein [Streptomyces sp. NPDC050418]|uniref:acyltransferase domain-containing protein n=1 Tax=Streptomyces sp. NPDC050418 TaxID=3365612 RepID=UPI003789BFCC